MSFIFYISFETNLQYITNWLGVRLCGVVMATVDTIGLPLKLPIDIRGFSQLRCISKICPLLNSTIWVSSWFAICLVPNHYLHQCLLIILWNSLYTAAQVQCGKFYLKKSQKIAHSSPVRARYGVSLVDSASDWYFTPDSAEMYAISCYIGSRFNGTRLYWEESRPRFLRNMAVQGTSSTSTKAIREYQGLEKLGYLCI